MAIFLDASQFTLFHRTTTTLGTTAPYTDVVNDLHVVGPLPWASVDAVLDSANRVGAGVGNLLGISAFAQGWVWLDDDNGSSWFPQGITTSADYHADGIYNGRTVILVSWYDHLATAPDKGVRISFVDMTMPSTPKYRHVLLVEPYYEANGGVGTPNFKVVNVHAGGIMWYGDLLYVVDTLKGIRVFDTSKMMQVTATGDTDTVGRQPDGSYTAYNYRYVLPQTHAYDAIEPLPPGDPSPQPEIVPISWSFISLDRTTTPDSIVVGEFESPGDGKRLFRWNIDSTTRLLKTVEDIASAVLAVDVSINEMQGATSVNGKYYISRSNQNDPGNVLTWVPGNLVESNDAPTKPEDVSYDGTTGWLWSLTETRDQRHVFARTASDLQ